MQIIRNDEHITKDFLHGLPKAELHIHLEGTLEPQLVCELGKLNQLPAFVASNAEDVKSLMGNARDLPSFIKVYEHLLSVLQTEQDFYRAASEYLRHASEQGVVYVEIFFDPQLHTTRGIAFETVMAGLKRAKDDAVAINVRCAFIMCFNRDRPIQSALEHLDLALTYRDLIIGVGTDNPEHTGFPNDFAPVFEKAAKLGFRLTSHCDADFKTSVENISGCFELLHVERIDHGVNILEDEKLVNYAREQKIGFTVCPAYLYTPVPGKFNKRYFKRCARAAKEMLDAGLCVTLSSDDPGIMCSQYIGDVYVNVCKRLCLPKEQMVDFAINGFKMAWITVAERQAYLTKIDKFIQNFNSL